MIARILSLRAVITLLVAVLLSGSLSGLQIPRSGLNFSFGTPSIVNLDNEPFFSIDVLVSSDETDHRMGTGMIMLNYNSTVFGESVSSTNNVIVTPGTILSQGDFPGYGLILRDNTPTRLAITFEYVLGSGSGGLIDTIPRAILNLRLRIQNYGASAGLSFVSALMEGQQFLDDNYTEFYPVQCADTENSLVPAQPEDLNISVAGGSLTLSWQQTTGCSYTIYSSSDPNSNSWQTVTQGLSTATWSCAVPEQALFYKVTARDPQDAE